MNDSLLLLQNWIWFTGKSFVVRPIFIYSSYTYYMSEYEWVRMKMELHVSHSALAHGNFYKREREVRCVSHIDSYLFILYIN